MKNKLRIIIIIVLILIVVLLTATFVVSNILLTYSVGKAGSGGDREGVDRLYEIGELNEERITSRKESEKLKNKQFFDEYKPEEVFITSNDNLKLAGFQLLQKEQTDKWAVVIHGYRENHNKMQDYIRNYYTNGYNVIAPDLRACGDSEGKYFGMGGLEKDDIKLWVDYILNKNENAFIVVHGRSMGAATTMMYAGIEKRQQVKVFIEDCGYTRMYDIFANELKKRFNLPAFPIMNALGVLLKIRCGYNISDVDAEKLLKNCEKPMLFIHGTGDDFVPFEMQDILYNAINTDKKEKIVVENAGHVESIYFLEDEYFDKVFEFIERYSS